MDRDLEERLVLPLSGGCIVQVGMQASVGGQDPERQSCPPCGPYSLSLGPEAQLHRKEVLGEA